MRRLGLALIALAVVAFPPAAHAAPSISGTLRYGTNPDGSAARNKLAVDVTVGEGDSVTRLELFPNVSIGTAANPQTTAGGSCFATDQNSGVVCNYSPPLPPGTNVTLTSDYPGNYPEDGGAQLTARSGGVSPDQTRSIHLDGPAEPTPAPAPGPAPGAAGADLSATLRFATIHNERLNDNTRSFRPPAGVNDLVMVMVRAEIANAGPEPARASRLDIDPPVLPPGSGSIYWAGPVAEPCAGRVFRKQPLTNPMRFECGDIAAGQTGVYGLSYVVGESGRFSQRVNASSLTGERNPADNADTLDVGLSRLPDSRIGRHVYLFTDRQAPLFAGDAEGSSAIQVDVGIRAESGRGSAAAKRCRWVANRRGRIKTAPCNRATWLRAGGGRSWRLKLARPLPAGRYTVVARASSPGLRELTFDARDGNTAAIHVRRSR